MYEFKIGDNVKFIPDTNFDSSFVSGVIEEVIMVNDIIKRYNIRAIVGFDDILFKNVSGLKMWKL